MIVSDPSRPPGKTLEVLVIHLEDLVDLVILLEGVVDLEELEDLVLKVEVKVEEEELVA